MNRGLRQDPDYMALEQRVLNVERTRTDSHQRGIGNAADAVNPRDYVTKRQLDEAVAEIGRTLDDVQQDIRTTSTGGTSDPTSTPVLTLPRATHPIAFGYWIPDGNIPTAIMKEHYDENKGYTDLYVAWFRVGRQYCNSAAPVSEMMATADELVRRAHGDGKAILILLDLPFAPGGDIPAHMDRVLDAMTPYWSRVQYIDLADEPAWTKTELEGHAANLRAKMTARGLAHPQIQVTLVQRGAFGSLESPMVSAAGVDVIGIECYVDPPGGTAEENESVLRSFLTQAKGKVPASKKIAFIIQAYARNGAWTDITTLTALQTVPYMLAYDDARVCQITMFSYGRTSGTREHPELKVPHQSIWQAITPGAQSLPTCGGAGNPANCPRYCRGGLHATAVDTAQAGTIAAHPAYFVPGVVPLKILDEPTAALYIADIVSRINTSPGVRAQANAGDNKEIMTKDAVNPQNSEHYALWATNLEVRYNPGAYRATCTPSSW